MFSSLILRQSGVRRPGRYREPIRLAITPSRPWALAASFKARPSPSTWVATWRRWSVSTISSSSSRRSSQLESGRVVAVEPQQVEHDERDGDLLDDALDLAFVARFMRCWSASNEFLPSSSNATISPSITAFTWSTSSWIMWISGYWAVASRPVRVRKMVSPVAS